MRSSRCAELLPTLCCAAPAARAAQFMNINASKGLYEVMKTNLGPKGTIKMLVGGAGGAPAAPCWGCCCRPAALGLLSLPAAAPGQRRLLPASRAPALLQLGKRGAAAAAAAAAAER